MNLRSQREKASVDQSDIYQNSEQWHQNFAHVFGCPNTLRNEQLLQQLLKSHVANKKVLDLGCGYGGSSLELLKYQAGYVCGIDISERFINSAKKHEQPNRLHFALQDVSETISGTYDLILGRAILHHLDYQEVLLRLYKDNLNDNGVMLFMEPLGSNLLLRLYWQISKNAHTPDERPFMRRDLTWMKQQFPDFSLIPINYFSLLFGILSSKLFSNPQNLLMRIGDVLDRNLAKIDFLKPNYRQAIFIIKK